MSRPAAAPNRVSRALAWALALPVVAYRRWVSPSLPARCRFYPSCSAYTLEALHVHGAFRGLALGVWRFLRCQPFHPGGYDPVPPPRATPSAGDHPNRTPSGAAR